MKKIILSILIAIMFSGCIEPLIEKAPPPSEEDLLTYVKRFEEQWGQKVYTPIYFNELEDGIAGTCYMWSSGETKIDINPKYWPGLLDEQRELLVFHELGHCVLDKDHDDSKFEDYCPTNIMNSYLFSSWSISNCYNPNYNYYMNKLFDRNSLVEGDIKSVIQGSQDFDTNPQDDEPRLQQ